MSATPGATSDQEHLQPDSQIVIPTGAAADGSQKAESLSCEGTTPLSPSSTPTTLEPFDWSDFETRYENALRAATEEEKNILRESESLSKFFNAWASAASTHDDERAVKRLQTRQRFVNLSEEHLAQKQLRYQEVVQAFESALALLRSD